MTAMTYSPKFAPAAAVTAKAGKSFWARVWDRIVEARMRQVGAKTEMDLQGYLVERLEKYLSTHGKRLIGWDEILEAKLPAGSHGDVMARHRRRPAGRAPGP